MAPFRGLLNDDVLNFISIDNFESHTHSCTVFFLSHIHSDHTHGWFYSYEGSVNNFADMINKSDKYIYCSSITRRLILNNPSNKVSPNRIKSLDAGQHITVYSPNKSMSAFITVLPASHCMGSVMFLIEYGFKRILFACDFRLRLNDLKTFRTLTGKKIDDLYIDATFAHEKYTYFPSRDESISCIISVIKHWISVDYSIKIRLALPAQVGTEYIFKRLSQEFKHPVHVSSKIYDRYYRFIEDTIHSYITNDFGETFIHACYHNEYNCTGCHKMKNGNYKTLKPCALSFMGENKVIKFESENFVKVCYSSHCSLTELKELVQFVKPKHIIPMYDTSGRSLEEITSCIQPSISNGDTNLKVQNYDDIKQCTINNEDNIIYEQTLREKKQNERKFISILYS